MPVRDAPRPPAPASRRPRAARTHLSSADAFGVYLHVPFCAQRCDYCAFATWTDRAHLITDYVEACRREAIEAELLPATSVFFGGGTPSLIPGDALMSILAVVAVRDGAEVTVECNPETVTPDLLDAYRRGGVTRLSFGVQSMDPVVLASLGRSHDPSAVERSAALAAAAAFDSWNADLIYGAAGESLAQWRETVERVIALGPTHISAYALTVEAGTPLAKAQDRHPDDDDLADKYLLADELLAAAGFENYEISNWARPGHECRHNQLYWSQGDYRGIGCAAHSHVAGRRWWNVRTPERYIAAITAGRSPVGGEEVLDDDERRRESLQLALRTRRGVPAEVIDARERSRLAELVEDAGEGRLRLSRAGRLLANEVALAMA